MGEGLEILLTTFPLFFNSLSTRSTFFKNMGLLQTSYWQYLDSEPLEKAGLVTSISFRLVEFLAVEKASCSRLYLLSSVSSLSNKFLSLSFDSFYRIRLRGRSNASWILLLWSLLGLKELVLLENYLPDTCSNPN